MTIVKSARKNVESKIEVKILSIKFDSKNMSNTISWEVKNPAKENIVSNELIIFQNDTSTNAGRVKSTIEFSPEILFYVQKNIEIVSNKNYFRTYSYQCVVYTDKTSKSSMIEKFDPREIFEIEAPKQVSFTVKNGRIYFTISCNKNKFATNIFVFRKRFDDDVFERIAIIPYRNEQTFIDKNVSMGIFYEYRFMSYDIFNHFSQKIVKIDIFAWDRNMSRSKKNILFDPIPIAEYASESSNKKYIKLKISNVDSKCTIYRIKRRDLSEKRRCFEEVEQWDSSILFNSNNSRTLEFVDSVIRDSSYYQYSVQGFDKFGNSTDIRQSNIIQAKNITGMPATPIDLSGEIISSYPTSVKLSWMDDNLNQKLSDIISGSSELFPKENLYYFKVFRRRYDELNFEQFPEQSQSFIVDSCDEDGIAFVKDSPYYKPPAPMRDNKYYYYIGTFDAQTNIMSNRSKEILVDLTVAPGEIKELKSFINTTFEPLKCVLSWSIEENEKTLDAFSIDRIEENGLWIPLGKSYFNTTFVDTEIKRNKKYLYRVQAIDFERNAGNYSYIVVKT